MFGWGISTEEYNDALATLDFINDKILKLDDLLKDNLNDDVKKTEEDKLKRLKISKKCIVYYYGIYLIIIFFNNIIMEGFNYDIGE